MGFIHEIKIPGLISGSGKETNCMTQVLYAWNEVPGE